MGATLGITKFGAEDCTCSDVRIHDVTSLNLKAIQGSDGQGNLNHFTRNDAGIGHAGRGIGHMPGCNKSGLAAKVNHFDVKYHMAWDFFITTRGGLTGGKDAEGDTIIPHFFRNAIGPEGVAI